MIQRRSLIEVWANNLFFSSIKIEEVIERRIPALIQKKIPALILGLETDYEFGEQLIAKLISTFGEGDAFFYALGVIQRNQGKWAKAEVNLTKAIALNPKNPAYLIEMAHFQAERGDRQEAVRNLEKANSVALTPIPIHRTTGLLIRAGAYKRAWEHFESYEQFHTQVYRAQVLTELDTVITSNKTWQEEVFADEIRQLVRSFLDPVPLWKGESLRNRNILLHSNPVIDGFGDIVLWLRFVPEVAALGANIILVVPPSLRSIAAQLPVTIWTNELTGFQLDYRLPLNLLPGRFGTQADTIPVKPYLIPEKNLVTHWRRRFATFPGLRVGLVWRALIDHARTIKPEEMAQLLSVPGVSFFSLQVHERAASDLQVIRSQGEITDLACELTDFHQTAAAIAALDLVITVDTAVANLCGAMGRSDWVMLPLYKDFRWPAWFPTMRLFCQPALGRWKSPLDEVTKQLSVKIQNSEIS